jgi:hypothetical protein
MCWVAAHDYLNKAAKKKNLPISKTELWSFGLFLRTVFLKLCTFTNQLSSSSAKVPQKIAILTLSAV